MVNSAIVCEDLLVVRGGVEVLHSVTVSVPMGTVTGLLGPSGCGKTTLMRAVVGTQIVQSGRVPCWADLPEIPRCAPKSATARRARRSTWT